MHFYGIKMAHLAQILSDLAMHPSNLDILGIGGPNPIRILYKHSDLTPDTFRVLAGAYLSVWLAFFWPQLIKIAHIEPNMLYCWTCSPKAIVTSRQDNQRIFSDKSVAERAEQ